MSLALNDEVNRRLVAQLPAGVPAQIPPACLLDMQGEFLEYMEGESLRVRFPVLARYANPLGHMQGGFIAAALDNTLGPFSYLIAPPSATVSLSLQYLRPVTPGETHIECHARLLERTRSTLHLAGEALLGDGRRAAVCQAICQILPTPG